MADDDLLRTGVHGGKGVLEDGLVVFGLHGVVEEERFRERVGEKLERKWSEEEEGRRRSQNKKESDRRRWTKRTR